MRTGTMLAGAIVALGLCVAADSAAAAPAFSGLSTQQSLIEPVGWRSGWGRCRYWRHECADRWGWGGRGYRRCLWRHGC